MISRRNFLKTIAIGTVAIALPIPRISPINPLSDLAIEASKLGFKSKFAYESLIVGVRRGSALILDNLGITVNLRQKWQDYADSFGIWGLTHWDLTETEKQQATLNAVLEEGIKVL